MTFGTLVANGAAAGDRPDFPAIAISPDGTDVYLVYDAFLQPWQPTTATARLMQGVIRHVEVSSRAVHDLHRGAIGDARGSSANGLTSEFLGDYNYIVATNTNAAAVWNDVRNAADCPAIDAFRQALANGQATVAPAPGTDCPPTFGNSDIFRRQLRRSQLIANGYAVGLHVVGAHLLATSSALGHVLGLTR